MDAKRLSDLILDMAQHPRTSPHVDLLDHATTRGWLAVRHFNAANNLHGQLLTKRAECQLMDEIHVCIFRGYIAALHAPETADMPPETTTL